MIVYFSITGQTRRFIRKTSLDSFEISPTNPFVAMEVPYLLVVPSYEIEATEPINDFIETGRNRDLCQGIIGGGNRNFSQLFCYTAKDLAVEYGIPYIYEFEFQGTQDDVLKVREIAVNISNGAKYKTPKESGYLGLAKGAYISGELEPLEGVVF